MGIERFFSSIEKNEIANIDDIFTKKFNTKIDSETLFIDFNSIVYLIKAIILHDLNKILYHIIKNKVEDVEKTIKKYEDYIEMDINNNISGEIFNNYFTEDVLNEIILENVVAYIFNMLENYVISDKLKLLYIAIDGVPSKAKMNEQKKRRYMGEITMLIKDKIFEKYEDELKDDKIRYEYEINKIEWKTHNITPGTKFMHKLNDRFESSSFEISIKNICKNIKKYIFSGPYISGEGENKIVNYIRSNNYIYNSCLIYSPDSDVTLLGLLLNSKMDPFSKKNDAILNVIVLRFNQQKNYYDLIYIDKLANNIFQYVQKQLNKNNNITINKNAVINDVVLLLTIFGNDFLPKIDAFNVKHDFNGIIDKYIKAIQNKNKIEYLIHYKNENNNVKRCISFNTLLNVFKNLQNNEDKSLQNVYMTSNYQNYNRLKKMFNTDQSNFTEQINKFLSKLKKFNNDLISIDINKFKTIWSSDGRFIKYLKELIMLPPTIKIKSTNNDEFLDIYYDYYNKNNKFPKLVIFRRFTNSINDNFHRNNLENSVHNIDPHLQVTSYDEELYKFNNMLDKYKVILNAQNINIGFIEIDYESYTFKTEEISEGVKRYYHDFFNIDDVDINNNKMIKLLDAYLYGLLWVFDYYFNNYNIDYHDKYVNTWYYPYEHAPLLTQVYNYLNKKNDQYIIDAQKLLDEYVVDKYNDIYFNSLEQLMFVSPNTVLKNIAPSEFKHIINNDQYYPNLVQIGNQIWHESIKINPSKHIDCRGVLFLTKCNLHALKKNTQHTEDIEFIKMLRNIKISFDTHKKTGFYNKKVFLTDYKNITTLDKLK